MVRKWYCIGCKFGCLCLCHNGRPSGKEICAEEMNSNNRGADDVHALVIRIWQSIVNIRSLILISKVL